MKYQLVALFLIAVNFFSSLDASEGQWRQLPLRSQEEFQQGLPGGEAQIDAHSIACCLNHPDYIYLSQDVSGVWRSTDAGESWQKTLDQGLTLQFGQSIQVDPNDPNIIFLTVDNSTIWSAEKFEGVYRSTDGGETWRQVLQTQFHFHSTEHRIYRSNITYDLSSALGDHPATRWYAAFPKNGLFLSEDAGESWSLVSDLSDHETVNAIVAHPTDGTSVYLASNRGLFISREAGANLLPVSGVPEGPVTSIAIDRKDENALYVTVNNEGIYRSLNGGDSFSLVLEWPASKIFCNPGVPGMLYLVGPAKQSLYSHNAGGEWRDFGEATTFPGLGRETGLRRWIDGRLCGIVANPDNGEEAVAFSRSTIFKTNDGGATWFESAAGLSGNAWSWCNGGAAFDRTNPQRFAFFCSDVGVRLSTTGGDYFESNTNEEAIDWFNKGLIAGIDSYSGDFRPGENSNVIIASVGSAWSTQLMRSEDAGRTWTLVTQGVENADQNLFIAFHPQETNVVYAGNKISYDAGETFQFIDFPHGFAQPTLVGMCRNEPDVLFAMNKSRTAILRSRDRGLSWHVYTQPGWAFKRLDALPTFAADPVDSNKIYTLDEKFDLACFDGESWRSFGLLNLPGGHGEINFVRTVTVDPNYPDIIYAGLFESGIPCIFRSMDGGDTWRDITENLPRCGMSAMKVNPHTGELYKGSAIGTWIYPSPYEVGVTTKKTAVNFVLMQNYPNPFNPQTTIEFMLEYDGWVDVEVFALDGALIRTLLRERRAAGIHHITWDGRDERGLQVPSGVYFYRIKTLQGVHTKKATLVR